MSVLSQLVRDLLPTGAFWHGPEAERFVNGIADAWGPSFALLDELVTELDVQTATRPVLLQWWNYLVGEDACVPLPSDTELLREVVRAFLGSESGYTIAGLERLVSALVPFLELRESLPTSTFPLILPSPLEDSGRILEVWYPPLFVAPETAECAIRLFSRIDTLRFVAPAATIGVRGATAGLVDLSWTFATDCLLRCERWSGTPGTSTLLDSTTLTLATQHGQITLADALALAPGLPVLGSFVRLVFRRDLGDGVVDITAPLDQEITFMGTILLGTATATTDVNSLIVSGLQGNTELEYTLIAWIVLPDNEQPDIELRPRVGGASVAPGAGGFRLRGSRLWQANTGPARADWVMTTGPTTSPSASGNQLVEMRIECRAAETINGVTVPRSLYGYLAFHYDDSGVGTAENIEQFTASWTGAGEIDGFELVTVPAPSAALRTGTTFSVFTPAPSLRSSTA